MSGWHDPPIGGLPPAAPPDDANEIVLPVAFLAGKRDNRPRPAALPWHELAGRLTKHAERHNKDGAAWSPVDYAPGATRKNENVRGVTAAVFDYDGQVPPHAHLAILDVAYACHTTFSHDAASPHFRVVVPLSRAVPGDQWPDFWLRARAYLCAQATIDDQCKDSSRLYYLPSCRPGAPRDALLVEGRPLDPTEVPPLPAAVNGAHTGSGSPSGPRVDVAGVLSTGATKGTRDRELFRLACKLRRADVPQPIAETLVLDAAANCAPPFPPDEARKKVASAYGRYQPEPEADDGLDDLEPVQAGH